MTRQVDINMIIERKRQRLINININKREREIERNKTTNRGTERTARDREPRESKTTKRGSVSTLSRYVATSDVGARRCKVGARFGENGQMPGL